MLSQVGNYRIRGIIGAGGMGIVYHAIDQRRNRVVALKVLSSELSRNTAFVERFRQEAATAARLNHPNIVTTYDSGSENGHYFIAMEYVEGRSLRAVFETEGVLAPTRLSSILTQIAAALNYAHNQGVIHRDVKPSNILLEGDDKVKLVDFGVSQVLEGGSEASSAPTHIGTPYYVSPEQAEGRTVDARSDIYSLGVVVYEALTGCLPFIGDTTDEVLRAHVQQTPPAMKVNGRPLAPAQARVVLKALAKRPQDRYRTATQFAAAFARVAKARQPVDLRSSALFRGVLALTGAILLVLAGYTGLKAIGPEAVPTLLTRTLALLSSPTAEVTPIPSPAPTTTATKSPGSTATKRPRSTATPSPSTPTKALEINEPTSTPRPTFTSEPTATQTPMPTSTATRVPQRPAPSPLRTATSVQTQSNTSYPVPALAQPNPEASTSGMTIFSWTWSGPALQSDQGFEVRIWRVGQSEHPGAAEPVRGNSITINIGSAYGVQNSAGDYYWTVALVRLAPNYQRIGPEAPPRLIRFQTGSDIPPPIKPTPPP